MTKYALIYENNDGKTIFSGSFVGKNHYRIKFVMYKYLKKILKTKKPIIFAIREIKNQKNIFYEGTTKKEHHQWINGVKIKAINRVKKIDKSLANKFWEKIKSKDTTIQYTHTHSYREEYLSDEVSLSETDSELEGYSDDEKLSESDSEIF